MGNGLWMVQICKKVCKSSSGKVVTGGMRRLNSLVVREGMEDLRRSGMRLSY